MSDPATAEWREALSKSTSAQLRQTQQALAASQADLTRVERELHDALRRAADLEQVREELAQRKFRNEGDLADIQDLTSERDDARAEAKEFRGQAELYLRQRDEALHDLARARFHHAHCTTEES
jgi:chromosome segregation ATPase